LTAYKAANRVNGMGGDALAAAVDMVGGQAKLARMLGVTQPNVWHWLHKSERVPGEYVLKIEEATGGRISRHDLRPDLYPKSMTDHRAAPAPATVAEEDRVRADCWRLVGRMLAAPPAADLLDAVGHMLGGEGAFGAAIDALAGAARGTDAEAASREYHDLFIGLARGELMPFASYYKTGFLYDKPLAKLRVDMERFGIAPVDNASDPEDHIASIAEMMAGLIGGDFGAPAALAVQKQFFDTHLAPWAPRFFADLEKAETAHLYRHVGAVGRLLMQIETEAFALAA
jgi:TorA maturation chaperone TorD/DNA-binding transcriptional regulator YdaS (Cro superfamily)